MDQMRWMSEDDARPTSDPAATIAAYLLAWPYVRQQIEALLVEQPSRSAAEIAADRADLQDLERCLNRVAVLAARLGDQPRTHPTAADQR